MAAKSRAETAVMATSAIHAVPLPLDVGFPAGLVVVDHHVQLPPRRRGDHRLPERLFEAVIGVQALVAVSAVAGHDQDLAAHAAPPLSASIARLPQWERMRVDVAIVGGGAAGLMCAIEAGKRGRRVVVLEHNGAIGTEDPDLRRRALQLHQPAHPAENFLSANPHFAKSALARYRAADFLELVERHGIPYHEKTLGQLFCDRSARDIVAMLEAECRDAGVRIETGCAIRGVTGRFATRHRPSGRSSATSLVIATGGLSIPKIGATPFGYAVAKQFGLATRPLPSRARSAHLRARRPGAVCRTRRSLGGRGGAGRTAGRSARSCCSRIGA